MAQDDFTRAVQDYTKAIYALQEPGGPVSTSALAERLGISAPSVSEMIRTLVDSGLVTYRPYHGVMLTPEGVRVALEVIRHHRLLELFLAETLGVPLDRVHEEAEVLEHAISEELEERIATTLGNPGRDPHVHPIPTREGTIEELASESLADLEPGRSGIFAQVSDTDPEVLHFLVEQGIRIGDRLELIERRPPDEPLLVGNGEQVCLLERTVARAMRLIVEEER